MTNRGKQTLIINIVVVIALFVFYAKLFGLKNAYNIIEIFSNFIPFIIAGFIMFLLNINERKWGKTIYGLVFLLLFYLSLKR